MLSQLRELQTLTLVFRKINKESLKILAKQIMNSLRLSSLTICATVDPPSNDFLAQMLSSHASSHSPLRKLSMAALSSVGVVAFFNMAAACELREIHLRHCWKLDDHSISLHIQQLLPACLTLETLSLPRCELGIKSALAFADALPRCKSITFLDISENRLGDDGALVFAGVNGTPSVRRASKH